MMIYLSKELEQFVHDAVRSGLSARDADVVTDALIRLKQAMPEGPQMPGKRAKRTKAALQQPEKPLTPAELDQYMLSLGLITQLPDPAEDIDDDDPDDEPVAIKGEPLPETII